MPGGVSGQEGVCLARRGCVWPGGGVSGQGGGVCLGGCLPDPPPSVNRITTKWWTVIN